MSPLEKFPPLNSAPFFEKASLVSEHYLKEIRYVYITSAVYYV